MIILLLPLVALSIITTVEVSDGVRSASAASATERLARLQVQVNDVIDALQTERTTAAVILGSDAVPAGVNFTQAADNTQRKAASYQRAIDTESRIPEVLAPRLDAIRRGLDGLPGLRRLVTSRSSSLDIISVQYSQVITDLRALNVENARNGNDPVLAAEARTGALYAGYWEAYAQEQAIIAAALGTKQLSMGNNLISAIATQKATFEQFAQAATPEQRRQAVNVVSQRSPSQVFQFEQDAVQATPSGTLKGDQSQWVQLSTDRRQAMLSVQRTLADTVASAAGRARAEAVSDVVFRTGTAVLLGLLALVVGLIIARSLVRPLDKLRQEALDIAYHRLPEAVRAVQESGGRYVPSMTPVRAGGRDEIGQVAAAFTVVQSEAVRVATEQAAMRQTVASMFGNLARRSQTLVGRVLQRIDAMERDENDPDRLREMFELDHLVTRMRRNDENLLVLSGAGSSSSWGEPASLRDVLRAAIAEVEQYQRVNLGPVDDVQVVAGAVKDLIHLLAELLENATGYSSPRTSVVVDAHRMGDRVVVQIEDRGVGLSAKILDEVNERLAQPPEIDIAVSRRMGLHVVSRLAARHGVMVRLRGADGGGVLALVEVPVTLLSSNALDRQGQQAAPVSITSRVVESSTMAPTKIRSALPEERRGTPTPLTGHPKQPAAISQPEAQPAPQLQLIDLRDHSDSSHSRDETPPLEIPSVQDIEAPSRRAEAPSALDGSYGSAVVPPAPAPSAPAPSAPAPSAPALSAPTPSAPTPSAPIFEAVQSEWFRTTGGRVLSTDPAPASWSTAADAGWQAAERASGVGSAPATQSVPATESVPASVGGQPAPAATAGATSVGLPRRVPMAQLVPGDVAAARSTTGRGPGRSPARPQSTPPRSAERVRGTLSRYRNGATQGRLDARAQRAATPETTRPQFPRPVPDGDRINGLPRLRSVDGSSAGEGQDE
ncbi:MAG: nitrate- and nitrite sensing domain-containing protein [Angustibacter sp.]